MTLAPSASEPTVVCDRQTAQGTSRRCGRRSVGAATDRRPLPPEGWWMARRKSRRPAQDSAGGIVDACGPKSPDSHRVVWGLTSRPPVPPAGFPPVSRLPARFFPSSAFPGSPFVRRSPGCSLRPLPGSSSPSVSLRVPFPLSNLHASAAARRFPRRWSRAAGTNATSSTTPLGSRDPPARRMGSGWARWDAATESPVASGRERRTSPRPNCPDRPLLTRTCGLSPERNVT
jgi:hypothetical protein